MLIAGWRLNLDALLARIVYRWSGRTLLAAAASCAAFAVAAGVVPPVWRGEARLELTGPPGARLEVDGKVWPRRLYAGRHVATATLPDGRVSSVEVVLRRGQLTSVVLPQGLPRPRVRALPPDGPDSTMLRASFVDGAWRAQSRRGEDGEVRTVALGPDGLQPISMLDAYNGRADIVTSGSRSYQALYRPDDAVAGGTVEIRGWGDAPRTVAITGTLSFLRWAPDAGALLMAERLGADGEELRLLRPDTEPVPVLAVPGQVSDIIWHPEEQAAALLSRHHERLTLTVLRFGSAPATRLLAEIALPDASPAANGNPASGALAVVPLFWSAEAIEWLAPDAQGVRRVWRATLDTLLPERLGALEAAALARTADGTLRVVREVRGRLAIGRQDGERLIVETWLPDVPASRDLSGLWAPDGSSLLLRSGRAAWLVDVPGAPGTK